MTRKFYEILFCYSEKVSWSLHHQFWLGLDRLIRCSRYRWGILLSASICAFSRCYVHSSVLHLSKRDRFMGPFLKRLNSNHETSSPSRAMRGSKPPYKSILLSITQNVKLGAAPFPTRQVSPCPRSRGTTHECSLCLYSIGPALHRRIRLASPHFPTLLLKPLPLDY